ncbi:MAG: hypothetical protein NTW32_04460 [Chloroflexi bacterium]|nr:hypothetical protein [Chloroflexota bacterium]
MHPKTPPHPGEILIAEYTYIAQTAFQANEKSARVTSFDITAIGSLIAPLITTQFAFTPDKLIWLYWGFAGLFLALALRGILTILELAKLRSTWFESIIAMNQIKEYYFKHFEEIEEAFAWRTENTPKKFKINSVGFMLVTQVSILSAAALGASVFFSLEAISGNILWLPALIVGVFFFVFQLALYRNNLR